MQKKVHHKPKKKNDRPSGRKKGQSELRRGQDPPARKNAGRRPTAGMTGDRKKLAVVASNASRIGNLRRTTQRK